MHYSTASVKTALHYGQCKERITDSVNTSLHYRQCEDSITLQTV